MGVAGGMGKEFASLWGCLRKGLIDRGPWSPFRCSSGASPGRKPDREVRILPWPRRCLGSPLTKKKRRPLKDVSESQRNKTDRPMADGFLADYPESSQGGWVACSGRYPGFPHPSPNLPGETLQWCFRRRRVYSGGSAPDSHRSSLSPELD